MTTQEIVNEIHAANKEEAVMVVWYRTPSGREAKRQYDMSDVLSAVAAQHEQPGMVPIAHLIRPVMVGTTVARPDYEPVTALD